LDILGGSTVGSSKPKGTAHAGNNHGRSSSNHVGVNAGNRAMECGQIAAAGGGEATYTQECRVRKKEVFTAKCKNERCRKNECKLDDALQ
jgi:hypothetical protein